MIPRRYIYEDGPTGRIRVGEIKMGFDGEYIVWFK